MQSRAVNGGGGHGQWPRGAARAKFCFAKQYGLLSRPVLLPEALAGEAGGAGEGQPTGAGRANLARPADDGGTVRERGAECG
jgi:hypothetical protein